MAYFEIVAIGFSAESDSTDDRVIWVSADNNDVVSTALQNAKYLTAEELPSNLPLVASNIDFLLPADNDNLIAKLREFAETPP